MARRKGAGDECVVRRMLNYIDRLGSVTAELKRDQEPLTMETSRVLASRRKTTVLTESATPRGSKGSFRRGNEQTK